jgi:SAM-dependent methyltransferase
MKNKINSILKKIKAEGFLRTGSAIKAALLPARTVWACRNILKGLHGIEIGGPSAIFSNRGSFPIYKVIGSLDNCNFNNDTIWEDSLKSGKNFNYYPGKEQGEQYISEATDLGFIDNEKYDFVLSSHMIEHSANPIKALMEWRRVTRPDGLLVLIVPHKDGTFDHARPVTPLAHLIEDYQTGMGENDLSHIPEILDLHDLLRDKDAGDIEMFSERSRNNFKNRGLHHHVFDTLSAERLVRYSGFEVISVEPILPCHIILLARKKNFEVSNNGPFSSSESIVKVIKKSPFTSDRLSFKSNHHQSL